MKKLTLLTLLFAMFVLVGTTANAEGLGSANVKFGKPQDGQTNCDGKGICMLSSIGSSQSEVPVTFVLVEDPTSGFYTLTMQFNISLMSSSDHDYLYQHFLYPDGEPRPRFVFEQDYAIEDRDLCRQLNVDPGSIVIKPGSISGDRNIEKINDADIRLTYVIPMSGK